MPARLASPPPPALPRPLRRPPPRISQSAGDITEGRSGHYEYVRDRFETEVPGYREAVRHQTSIFGVKLTGFITVPELGMMLCLCRQNSWLSGEDSDGSTVCLSGSDGETEV